MKTFAAILPSLRKFFGSKSTKTSSAKKPVALHLETLERRDVPTTLYQQLEFTKLYDYQIAVNDAKAAINAANNFNPQQASNYLALAKAYLTQSAQCVLAEVNYGYETATQGQHDLAVLYQAYNQVNQLTQAVSAYFSGFGGSLNYAPNFFGGANMLY